MKKIIKVPSVNCLVKALINKQLKKVLAFSFICSIELIAHEYHSVDNWLKPPAGMKQLGSGHGEIDVDKDGLIYVSVTSGEKAGIQVYNPEGKYLHNVANAPKDFHGFVIHKEKGQEFIYGARLDGQSLVKMTLDGKIVMTIQGDAIPDKYKKDNKLKLTSTDVAPNGDIYVVDGYGLDFIHRFNKDGKYLSSFGGRKAPYDFLNCHKIFIDKRYSPARILCTNRKQRTLVHLSLDGKMLGVHAKDLRRPSCLDFWGDNIAVAEIEGRISILDKQGKVVSVVSFNKGKYKGNRAKPQEWKPGIVGSPHGITFDQEGNLLMTEFNRYGRVMRFDIKQHIEHK